MREGKQMIATKVLKISIVTGIVISGLTVLLMIMDWFGYWGQGEYEFAFSIFVGLIQLFMVSALITVLCWRLHQLELTIDKLERKEVKFDLRIDHQNAPLVVPLEKTDLAVAPPNDDPGAAPTQSTKNCILAIHKNKVYRGNEELVLSHKEFMLIKLLMEGSGLCSTEEIIGNVWSEEATSTDRTSQDVTHLISRLRRKINIYGHDYINSHPGRGYEFRQWTEK